jgi:hypothetical protein
VRFDEFAAERNISVSAVDRFAGYSVRVGLPADWWLFDSAPGVRIWVWRGDPRIGVFCSNAVFTMHRVEEPFDAGEMFGMLVDQQLQLVPPGQEQRRELASASEGVGFVGSVAIEFPLNCGTVVSESRSRIITTERLTLVAQLTLTALQDSPVDRAKAWMTVREEAVADEGW